MIIFFIILKHYLARLRSQIKATDAGLATPPSLPPSPPPSPSTPSTIIQDQDALSFHAPAASLARPALCISMPLFSPFQFSAPAIPHTLRIRAARRRRRRRRRSRRRSRRRRRRRRRRRVVLVAVAVASSPSPSPPPSTRALPCHGAQRGPCTVRVRVVRGRVRVVRGRVRVVLYVCVHAVLGADPSHVPHAST